MKPFFRADWSWPYLFAFGVGFSKGWQIWTVYLDLGPASFELGLESR